jgi:protein gp37
VAKVRFFSLEPLLGPIVVDWLPEWVIVGADPARSFVRWTRRGRARCATPALNAARRFFMKQPSGPNPLPIPADLLVREFPRK